jgi:hypothetical protein
VVLAGNGKLRPIADGAGGKRVFLWILDNKSLFPTRYPEAGLNSARGDDTADGVPRREDNATAIDGWGRCIWRVQTGARLGNQVASAGWAGIQIPGRIDPGVAILTD